MAESTLLPPNPIAAPVELSKTPMVSTTAGEDEANPTKDLDYFLAQNPTEVERLGYQHEIIKDFMGGKLVLAPVNLETEGLHILDTATADGYWLRDLQSSLLHNTNTYTGTDIVPSYFPSPPPPRTTLVVQSITTPYPPSWHSHFDLVHQRLALPGCGPHPMRPAVDALAALVKPGGWIQLLEADHSGPNEHESPAMWDAFRLIKELFKAMGAGSEYARELGEWLREGGMEGVGERVLDVPLGRKNPKKELAAMGVRSFMSAVAGLVEVARGITTSFSTEELDGLVPRVEKELTEVGCFHRIYAVWGRRPLKSTVV